MEREPSEEPGKKQGGRGCGDKGRSMGCVDRACNSLLSHSPTRAYPCPFPPAPCCSSLRWGLRTREPTAVWPPIPAAGPRRAVLSASASLVRRRLNLRDPRAGLREGTGSNSLSHSLALSPRATQPLLRAPTPRPPLPYPSPTKRAAQPVPSPL